MTKEELLKGLSEEQVAKLGECNSKEEILKLAKEEGIELTDEQLEVVSGGGCFDKQGPTCPACGSSNTKNNLSIVIQMIQDVNLNITAKIVNSTLASR